MKLIVNAAKKVKNALGKRNRIVYQDEIEMRKKFRRSIVAKKDLIKGEKISLDKIDFKRPGYGIEPNKATKYHKQNFEDKSSKGCYYSRRTY